MINNIFELLWGIVVGAVFSTVGAAGGLLSSFGFISLFGIDTPNDVKLMSQLIVIATTLIFIPKYFKSSALIVPLGLVMGIFGILGAIAGSTVSAKYLNNMSTFLPLFGVLTLAIALQLYYKSYKALKQEKNSQENQEYKIENLKFNIKNISFDLAGDKRNIPHAYPAIAGFSIAFIASMFGVGGGFLLVPFLNSVLNLPMKVIPGTVAISVLMSTLFSSLNYMKLGANIHMDVFPLVLAGALVGAYLGPNINKKLKNAYLQLILAIIITFIALKYLL